MTNTPILLADDTIDATELADLADWIKSGKRLTKGPLCLEFENSFAEWQGAKHAVFVNSGSSANLLIIQALLEGGYLSSNRVIAPAVSWVTTVSPLLQLGLDVRLVDCDKSSLGIDAAHLEKLCEEHKPSMLILVHVLGHEAELAMVKQICDRYGVLLVEDSCEALGSIYEGCKLGSHGKAGSFSFYYGHHISTIEGGMVVTDDTDLYHIMLSIRSHGWARDVPTSVREEWRQGYDIDQFRDLYTFYYSGFNLRSTDLNAFLGLRQLQKLDEVVRVRERNEAHYAGHLQDIWRQRSQTDKLSSFAFAATVENRLEVYESLRARNIECRPLICGNIGLHPFWVRKFGPSSFPYADVVHNKGLYLPNHFKMSEDDIARVASVFKDVAQPCHLLD